MDEEGFSLAGGVINSKGQESGSVIMAVGQPGIVPEGGGLQAVFLEADSMSDILPGGFYGAVSCLNHGKIVFE